MIKKLSVVDIGIGNVGSVINMIRHIGYEASAVSTVDEIENADKLVFPGVGHWNHGASRLRETGMASAIIAAALDKEVPLLGICLGMQLLFKNSEEGVGEGLGLIPGRVKRFEFKTDDSIGAANQRLRVPHMGWNLVKAIDKRNPLLNHLECSTRFYFVHSYHATDVPEQNQLLSSHYGYEFTCAVFRKNIFGFQFHPEKSHKFGMQLLKNFVEYPEC